MRTTIEAIAAQTAGEHEIICTAFSDFGADARVRVVEAARGLGRGEALARLEAAALHDWIVVLDAGDQLVPDAIAEIVQRIADVPSVALIYSDEDEVDPAGARRSPYFKPPWSPQLLQAFNYFGRLTAISRHRLQDAGGFDPQDGAGAEWSAHLRIAEAAARDGWRVERVTRVLCHRAEPSTSARLYRAHQRRRSASTSASTPISIRS